MHHPNRNVVKYGTIDLLKHILAIAVLFMHMPSKTRFSPELNLSIGQMATWIDGAVIGFFMISGYFFRPHENPRSAANHLRKSGVRYGTTYLFFSLLYGAAMIFMGKDTLPALMVDIIQFKGGSMQLYFLPYLWITLVMYSFVTLVTSNHRSIVALLVGIFLLIALLIPTSSAAGSDPRLLLLYIPSFGIGYLAALSGRRLLTNSAILALIAFTATGFKDNRFFDMSIASTLFAISILLKDSFLKNRPLPGSAATYLLHTPILNFLISAILMKAGITEWGNLLTTMTLTYLICVATALLAQRHSKPISSLLLE